MSVEIDQSVIDKIKKGSELAFSMLYDRYYTYLNTIALYYIFDRNTANEIVNDVFINVWNTRDTLVHPIQYYLIQAVKNRCLNHIRKKQIEARVNSEHKYQMLELQRLHIHSDEIFAKINEKELETMIRNAANSLPEKCKEIFELYFFMNKKPMEIAEQLRISVNTVRVQIKNSLDRLRDILNSYKLEQ